MSALATFFAKKVVEGFPGNANTKKAAVSEIQLANRISEIMIETQIAGASFLKAHIIDPELALSVSGWIDVKEGLLEPIEVEFPEGSKWHWILCAVEGSTNVADANLIVTFEDRIVYFLRQYYGTKFAPSGIQTRAQFIRGLITEIGRRGEPKAGFVCPSINVVQPIETESQAESKKTHTEQDKQEKEEAQQKRGGLGAGSITIEGQHVTRQQALDISTAIQVANRLKAPTLAVEAMMIAAIGESNFHRESVNSSSGAKGIWQSLIIPGNEVAKQAEFFLKGGESFQNGGAIKSAGEKLSPGEIATKVEASGEPASFYEKHIADARKIISESGGISGGSAGSTEESVSGVGQLQRGTQGNPDEDSFECAVRLATQVDWFFFSDNHNFFYMDGPDMAKQKPALYVDVANNRIRFPDGTKREGVIHAPTTFHWDNTTFQYRISHKVTKRVQRKSKAIRPASPAEVKLLLECDINQFHAGQAMRIVNSGPMNGQWIITNTRRECLKDIYTEIILEPPIEPLPEPRSTGGTEELENGSPTGNASSGSALAAFNAASALSEMQIPYSYGGGHGSNQLAEVKKGFQPGLDCSSSTCWVLHTAGMYPSTTAQTSGELANFGESGPGKEMTIWAGPNHVYIEFHIGGHETAQINTNGAQNGPRLYTLSKNPTYNTPGGTGSGGPFVARHVKGT